MPICPSEKRAILQHAAGGLKTLSAIDRLCRTSAAVYGHDRLEFSQHGLAFLRTQPGDLGHPLAGFHTPDDLADPAAAQPADAVDAVVHPFAELVHCK